MSVADQGEVGRTSGFGAATLCEAFQLTARRFSNYPALRAPGGVREMTWEEYARRVRAIAGGFARLGVGHGDAVALMLVNRPEFHLIDTALMHLGAVPFSIYNTSAPEQIAYLFANAGNRVLVTERRFVDALRGLTGETVEHVVVLEEGLPEADHEDFEASWREVEPDDLATVIYTSGTTGPPKGVQLTHRNILCALSAWAAVVPLRAGGRVISYLPCAHIGDRFLAHYVSLATGSAITSVEDLGGLLAGLVETRPTCWLGVPRVWEKFKAALEAEGIDDPARLSDDERTAVLARLGLDQADWVASGAAPVPVRVLEYFLALGLPIVEGWAMSEVSCAGTLNPPGEMRLGTVGRPLPGVEIALADDGELLVRGPNVMDAYRDDPVRTAEAIDADGWLHTGDIAVIDADGYVSIVDRKKELIINAAGKNMSPTNIEQQLKAATPLIGQACVIGDRRPYNVALLVLDPDAAIAYATAHSLPNASPAALATDEELQIAVAAAVGSANSHLSRVEQIKRFVIMPSDWQPDGDELTATMKLKRRAILDKYGKEIDALYAEEGAPRRQLRQLSQPTA